MGAVLYPRHGWLIVRLVVAGRRWQESTSLADTPENRGKLAPFVRKVNADVKAGVFDARSYLHYFPNGNRAEEMRDALSPHVERRSVPSFDDYRALWLERRQGRARRTTHRDYRLHTARVANVTVGGQRVGSMALDAITPPVIEAIRTQWQAAGMSEKYIRNMLAGSLRSLFRDAWKVDRYVSENPIEALEWKRRAACEPDPFSQVESEAILAGFRERARHYQPFIATLFWTGMRPSEAAGLAWGDVDLRAAELHVRHSRVEGALDATKTQASRRTVRLIPEMVALLGELRPLDADRDTPVFVGPRGEPIRQRLLTQRQWRRVLVAKKVRPRRLYDARATFISLALGEVDIHWLAKQVGTSIAMIERHYGRWLPEAGLAQLELLRTALGAKMARTGATPGARMDKAAK